MIKLYSGTGGSGKSLHLAREIMDELTIRKKSVIANFPVNMDMVTKKGRRKTGAFTYLPNDLITVPYLLDYARKNHKAGKEGQSLIVIDEAGIMFNSRDHSAFDRKAWINFFMTHRHYGYNVILVSQSDRLVDRQIRAFVEYDIKHRKANNFRTIGFILTVLHIKLFVAITVWYGMREKCGSEFFVYRRKYGRLYDTMMLFGGEQHGTTIADETRSGCVGSGGDTASVRAEGPCPGRHSRVRDSFIHAFLTAPIKGQRKAS